MVPRMVLDKKLKEAHVEFSRKLEIFNVIFGAHCC